MWCYDCIASCRRSYSVIHGLSFSCLYLPASHRGQMRCFRSFLGQLLLIFVTHKTNNSPQIRRPISRYCYYHRMSAVHRLPTEHSLFIATSQAIQRYTFPNSNITLLECNKHGQIGNATVSKDNCSLFAVASGHLVVLHDAALGTQRKHRLKVIDVISSILYL